MASDCKIDANRSPTFKSLLSKYKREYPNVESDVQSALRDIAKDFRNAKKARRIQIGSGVEMYKYRQNSSDIRRGASYGWRIDAIYEKSSNTLYPVLVYPKTVMEDANDATILACMRELRSILGYCKKEGCEGKYAPASPLVTSDDGSTKLTCAVCGGIAWVTASE